MSALARGEIVRIRGQRWVVLRIVSTGGDPLLDVRGCDRENQDTRAAFLLPIEHVDRLPGSTTPRVTSRPRWRAAARAVIAGARPAPGLLVTAARAAMTILPYQLEPALAVTRGLASRLLLADDVGLGKTVQAGLIVAETLERAGGAGHALIVTPAALRDQWAAELHARFGLAPALLDAAAAARTRGLPGANPWSAEALVVTSVDYVKRPEVLRALEAIVWDVVVFDEAHNLAGRSDRHAAARRLGERARVVVLVTATPHSGADGSLRQLQRLGELEDGGGLALFRRTREVAGPLPRRRSRWLAVRPTAAEQALHAALLAYARLVFAQRGRDSSGARLAVGVLLRRASSSASSLARSLDRRLALLDGGAPAAAQRVLPLGDFASLDDEPALELSWPGLHDGGDERRQLEWLRHLAAAAARGESKMARLLRLLGRADEPAIVFTEYRDTLATLAEHWPVDDAACLHGGLTASERREALRRFTTGDARVLLATDAASEGLNLQPRCRLVVHLEVPWTPLRLEQRAGRVDRIGQTRRVHEVLLVAAGTSEDATVARLVRRRARVHEVLERCVRADLPDPVEAPPPPLPDLLPLDLREAARAEAARLTLLRRLGCTRADVGPPWPVAAATQHRRTIRRGIWAIHLEFVDAADDRVWDALMGLTFHTDQPPPRRARELRALASRLHASLAKAVARAHGDAATELARELAAVDARAVARERAIRGALERQQARLAARLRQPALFFHRGTHEAAGQAAVLRETLAVCDRRLARLDARRRLTPGAARWALALLLP